MRSDGIDLIEGSEFVNLTCATGTAFPGTPSEGELFYRTDGGNVGLYVYSSSTWQRVAQTTEVAPTVHDHDTVYEPLFAKNSGFNKNLGTSAGTVSEGNHNHDTVYVDTAGDTMTGNLNMGSNKITGLANGTLDSDAVNKAQLDAAQAGILVKAQCRVVTTGPLPAVVAAGSGVGKTLTRSAVGILTIDGVNTVLGDRILVKDQAAAVDNGIYEVTTEGTAGVAAVLTRATDFDGTPASEVQAGNFTFIQEGTLYDKSGWALLDTGLTGAGSPVQAVVDTDPLSFTQFQGLPSYSGGDHISIVGDIISVVDGAGTGLNADLLDGQHGSYYLPAGSYTANDVLSKLLTVDGHLSGLDADKWDGGHKTISSLSPSGGVDGDVWFKYIP